MWVRKYLGKEMTFFPPFDVIRTPSVHFGSAVISSYTGKCTRKSIHNEMKLPIMIMLMLPIYRSDLHNGLV